MGSLNGSMSCDSNNRTSLNNMEDVQLNIDWDDIVCPICLDIPHNSVLLQCSSYDKGCRALVCDTNQLHSNCLDRFKTACGAPSSPVSDTTSVENREPVAPEDGQCNLTCPLCRGQVSGWIVVDKARTHLDEKKRCCDEVKCKFMGSYLELQNHAQLEHPHACPSKIDPARLLDWENFQQSSEIIDVLSTIHSEIPRGMVLGDYVIEYGDDDGRDEYDDFPGDDGNWWTSCILYQVFDNFRSSRNRRRTRNNDAQRANRRLSYDTSNSDEGSIASGDYGDVFVDDIPFEVVNTSSSSRRNSNYRRSRRHHSRFHDM